MDPVRTSEEPSFTSSEIASLNSTASSSPFSGSTSTNRSPSPAAFSVPSFTAPATFTGLSTTSSPYPVNWETVNAFVAFSYLDGHFVTSSLALSTPSSPTLPVQMAVTSLPNVAETPPSKRTRSCWVMSPFGS